MIFRILGAQLPLDDSGPQGRERLIEACLRHNDTVHRAIPADRLLTYHVSDGWRPVAEHLGVDVPDDPFPHVNAGPTVFENGVLATERSTLTSERLAWQ